MTPKSMVILGLALVMGLVAMYGTSRMLTKDRSRAASESQDVLVAARDLKVEEMLTPELVKVVSMPKGNISAGTFTSYKDVEDRWVEIRTLEGEPILDRKLAPKGTPAGLVARIPIGMRAFTVEVNEQLGVAGFVLPDHRVDLVQATTVGNAPSQAETILQDVLVLASGQEIAKPVAGNRMIPARSVTLALTPSQVDTVVAAKTKGALSLALRGVNDHKQAPKAVPAIATQEVIVASRDLSPDEVITREAVKSTAYPKALAPPRTLARFEDVEKRKVKLKIFAGEPILLDKLALPGEEVVEDTYTSDIDANLRMATRAVTIEVDEQSGVAGWVRPGKFVDVFHTTQAIAPTGADEPIGRATQIFKTYIGKDDPKDERPTAPGEARDKPDPVESRMILQDILVLDSTSVVAPDAGSPTASGSRPAGKWHVTLRVPVAEVAPLRSYQTKGTISLVLRNPGDHGHQPASVPIPAKYRYGMIYRGGTSQTPFLLDVEPPQYRTFPYQPGSPIRQADRARPAQAEGFRPGL